MNADSKAKPSQPTEDAATEEAMTPDTPAPDQDQAESAPQGEEPPAPAGPTAEEQIADLKDKLLRALAETENVRRRAERDKEDSAKYAVTKFARDVLTVADNLRRALDSAPRDEAADDLVKNLVTGVEMTEKELLAVMERHGIRSIDPLGAKFDHNFHQAMFELPGTGKPAGTVVQVAQVGYVLHDRLLRPAMVGVAKDDKPNGGKGSAGEHVDTMA